MTQCIYYLNTIEDVIEANEHVTCIYMEEGGEFQFMNFINGRFEAV